ncbi:MAG: hypothetical protein ACFB0C_12235 [Leptolyngbyaceae cyanobacterium]
MKRLIAGPLAGSTDVGLQQASRFSGRYGCNLNTLLVLQFQYSFGYGFAARLRIDLDCSVIVR